MGRLVATAHLWLRWCGMKKEVVGVVLGGQRCLWWLGGVTWHAGETEGAPRVVDAGDMGVWLSGLLVDWLSCFVGDVGC